jgi:hypothetical protein
MSNISSISWRERTRCIQLNDDMCFVLDQHPWIYIYSASSVKQQSAGRHVAPLGHIILIPFFILSP